MKLKLPPKSIIRCDKQTAKDVHEQLTSFIAGHAQATTTYRFYEVLDEWLGPWGQDGYPIGYGKFYNIAFTTNQTLMQNHTTQKWVWKTTIKLQEVLRDYVVNRVLDKTLPALTEAELREAAFDSHPQVYDDAGLATVVLLAPELLILIAAIPYKEFSPFSPDFCSTIEQVIITLGLVGPRSVGGLLAAAAGPAHNQSLAFAVQKSQRTLLSQISISREVGGLRNMINRGELDHIPWLDQVIAQLNARQFPDQGFARFAREVIVAAESRKRLLNNKYQQLLIQSPEVKRRVNTQFPNALDF